MKRTTLDEAYTMILEAEHKQLVNAPGIPKPGSDVIEGGDKAGSGGKPLKDGEGKKKPVEHKPKDADQKPKQFSEQQEITRMLPKSKFDELFNTTLNEDAEDGLGTQPLEQTGSGEFDDEMGDFPGDGVEDELGEEVDVATKLRLIIEDLTEIAEKLGSFDGGDEDEDGFEDDFDDDFGGGDEDVHGESVTYGQGGKGSKGGPGKGSHDGKAGSFSSKYHKDMKVKSKSVASKVTSKGTGKHKGPNKDTSGKASDHHADTDKFKGKGNMVVKNNSSKVGHTLFD